MRSLRETTLLLLSLCTLGVAQNAVDTRGIYLYTNDVSQITAGTANALTTSLNVTGVDGISIAIGWDAIEPSMGQYQWTLLDQWIGTATAKGKKIDLVIPAGDSTPAWLFQAAPAGAGATALNFTVSPHAGTTGVCQTDTIAAPWDPAFLAQWDAMLTAVSSHLKSAGTYGAVTLVRITGINRTSEELRLPAEAAQAGGLACVTDAISTWQQAGYKPSLLLAAWDAITNSFQKSFPDKTFGVSIIPANPFPAIGEDGNPIKGTRPDANLPLMTLAAQKWPGRFIVANDFLMPGEQPAPAVTGYAATLGTMAAFQTNEYLGSTGAGAACGEPVTNPVPCTAATFLTMLETGIYPLGHDNTLRSRYIEVFHGNTTAFPASIEQAHLELTCDYQLSLGGQAFGNTGGAGTITITTAANCPWTVGTLPSWVTLTSPASGVGPGTVTYQVTANAGVTASDLQGSFTIGDQSFAVQEAGCCYSVNGRMPHLAAGGGWTTTFTVVNKSNVAGTASESFFAPGGGPLALPLLVPQQSAISGAVLASTFDQPIAANGLAVLTATGSGAGPYSEGSAWLATKSGTAANLDGFAIFHYGPTQQEAVVPMDSVSTLGPGYPPFVLAFDNTNGVLTGVALQNSNVAATFPVIIRDDAGNILTTTSMSLPALGHTSFVLSSMFPQTANIRGTVEFDNPPGSPVFQVGVLGIRYTGGTTTTIPALPKIGKPTGSMAHLAAGNGWQTTFVLVNQGTSAATATLSFYDDAGSPLPEQLAFPQSGTALLTPATGYSQSIAPGASLWVVVSGLAAFATTGSAQLSATSNVGGFAIFRYNPNGQEAVVPLENRNAGAYLIAYDNTANTATGIAIANASGAPVNIPVTLRDDQGNTLGTSSIALNGNGHSSFILSTVFPQSAANRGTVEFDTPAGATISVLGIRSPPALTFTTLPPLAK